MIRAGQPYVPPACPRQHGKDIDITTAKFHFSTHTFQSAPNKPVDGLEVLVHFEGPNSRNNQRSLVNMVDASAEFPLTSPLATFSRLIENTPKLQQELRDILLERIAACHGVINNECWALGNDAGLREAITTLYRQLHSG